MNFIDCLIFVSFLSSPGFSRRLFVCTNQCGIDCSNTNSYQNTWFTIGGRSVIGWWKYVAKVHVMWIRNRHLYWIVRNHVWGWSYKLSCVPNCLVVAPMCDKICEWNGVCLLNKFILASKTECIRWKKWSLSDCFSWGYWITTVQLNDQTGCFSQLEAVCGLGRVHASIWHRILENTIYHACNSQLLASSLWDWLYFCLKLVPLGLYAQI